MLNREWLEMAMKTLMAEGLSRPEAHLHARLLLDGATELRFAHLVAPELVLEATTLQKLQHWLRDAARGRPIPYILGKAPFWGLEWEVDERVLIPRPETELLVETVLELLGDESEGLGAKASLRRLRSGHEGGLSSKLPGPQPPGPARIADLGTGSGVIAVCLAKERPDFEVFALDISDGALEIAARNADSHGANVRFLRGGGDWIEPLRAHAPFAAIVSNPPYIAAAEIGELAVGVRDFEPRLALDGGNDGLAPYREIACDAEDVLAVDGFIAVELGAGQFAAIRAIFEAQGWHVEAARRDLADIERVLVARSAI